MDNAINTILLSHSGVTKGSRERSQESLSRQLEGHPIRFTGEDPDMLFFTTGGSEQYAVDYLREGKFYLLAAGRQDNAYASATEVMAYARMKNIPARLFSLEDPGDRATLHTYLEVVRAMKSIRGLRAGLIGEPSPWLVASGMTEELLLNRLGITLLHLPWEELGDYRQLEPEEKFLEKFGVKSFPGLEDASRINNLLRKAIADNELKAVAVECFPLVQQQHVTACLSLADMNDEGLVAACEGDLASMTGMILVKAVTGMVPWMANVANIAGEKVLLAHCTAPTIHLSEFEVDTHFETGEGTAVKGKLRGEEVTIVRLDSQLEKVFLARGRISSRPDNPFACRTQVEVELSEEDMEILKSKPLGNHHLVLPGDHIQSLGAACEIMNFDRLA